MTTPAANLRTNDTTPTLSGDAGNATGDNATVQVKVYNGTGTGGTVAQTLNATRTGTTWTVDASTLAQGTYTVQATQGDAAGNTSAASNANTFVVDTTAPTVTLTAPANNSRTNDATPTLSGAAGNATGDDATVQVKIYNGTGTGGTVEQTLNATRTGTTWTVDASTLAEGHLHRPGDAGRRGRQQRRVERQHLRRGHDRADRGDGDHAGQRSQPQRQQAERLRRREQRYRRQQQRPGQDLQRDRHRRHGGPELQRHPVGRDVVGQGLHPVGGHLHGPGDPGRRGRQHQRGVQRQHLHGRHRRAERERATISASSGGNPTVNGFVRQGGKYIVYANATDAGSGVNTVSASVVNLTTGASNVPLTHDATGVTVGGTTYHYVSAEQTANGSLTAGSKSYTITATDNATQLHERDVQRHRGQQRARR